MQDTEQPCYGQLDGILPCSGPPCFTLPYKLWWRIKLEVYHLHSHLKDKGLGKTLKHSFRKFVKVLDIGAGRSNASSSKANQPCAGEVLNLQPSEWVEVKSKEEIRTILDEKGGYKGLHWMCNMWKHCGKRYRVYKRLEKMILESNGECRQLKNTVLLEGVTCDGKEWYDCDRSCFHYWREAWLKRVNEK